jgi:ABC-type nitrate/sulfonate/bicarbonate transport system ATPase subunit
MQGGPVIADISFSIEAGEFVTIVGPSGCGKSTLLNVIAGLQPADAGEVLLGGDGATARTGRVAYMHQRDLLLPWRTVRENARLGLEIAGVPVLEAERRVRALADRFGIGGVLASYPGSLSGGMRQRVALLRAVLPERGVLLLDEPFGALDAITRGSLQTWLGEVLDRAGKAVVLVTHDVEEALMLGDRVLVMGGRPGRVHDELEVPLPRPRPAGIALTPEFGLLKRRVLGALSDVSEAA